MTIQDTIEKLNEKAKTANQRAQRNIESVCNRLAFFSENDGQNEKLESVLAEAELWLS